MRYGAIVSAVDTSAGRCGKSGSYYIYPDGELAAETFRVIGQAMAHSAKVGLGHVTIASRERPVLVEPRGAGP
jgi:non-homologous end joining protein Ku